MRVHSLFALATLAVGSVAAACGPPEPADEADERPDEGAGEASMEAVELGPVDGEDLPPTDLDRVTAGDLAPDFAARSLAGDVHRLSDYRGDRNVVLFFYRGHW